MNFRIFLNIFLILSFLSLYTQSDVTKFYGEEFDFNIKSIENSLEPSSFRMKAKGEIISTCPMKGCWMNMSVSNDTILVRFKDYGFLFLKLALKVI